MKSAVVVKKVSNEEFCLSQTFFNTTTATAAPFPSVTSSRPGPTNVDLKFSRHEVSCKNSRRLNNDLVLNNDLAKTVWTTDASVVGVGVGSDKNNVFVTMRNFENRNFKKSCFRFFSSRRGIKKLTVFLAVGAVCFVLGVALPFMICKIGNAAGGQESIPEPEGLRSRPVPKKLENVVSEMENVLSNVLITVKTTHNYHYPRVVILLETWVSLVRSQVRPISVTFCSNETNVGKNNKSKRRQILGI